MNEYENISPYIGNNNQLISCQRAKLVGGMQEGVECIIIQNGGNLSATILPGRGMDIFQIRYKGKNLNYIAPQGIISSQYFSSEGAGFLRNFFVGFVTTCGLKNIGESANVEGESQGLHGRVANLAAENVQTNYFIKDDCLHLRLSGSLSEARLFGENLRLHREYEFIYETDKILVTDTIENKGFRSEAFVYALHINFGYPLLQENTQLIFESLDSKPRNRHAGKYFSTWQEIEKPEFSYQERCYFHDLAKDDNGVTQYTIFNPNLNLGVNVKYSKDDFPFFTQWKMLGKGEYVLGLEPMNVFLDGPKIGEPGCTAPTLEAGESIVIKYSYNFIDKI